MTDHDGGGLLAVFMLLVGMQIATEADISYAAQSTVSGKAIMITCNAVIERLIVRSGARVHRGCSPG